MTKFGGITMLVFAPDITNDWLNQFKSFYMTAIVGIVSIHGRTTKVCHRKQSNKSRMSIECQVVYYNFVLIIFL